MISSNFTAGRDDVPEQCLNKSSLRFSTENGSVSPYKHFFSTESQMPSKKCLHGVTEQFSVDFVI